MAQRTLPIAELRERVGERRIDPVYLVFGEETALRRQARDILQAAFSDTSGAGSVALLDGTDVTLGEVLDEARSLPLFAMLAEPPCRLVWVAGFEGVAVDDVQGLEAYLGDPVKETCLVLEAAKIDKRTSLYKLLARHLPVIDCSPVQRESEARQWIERRVLDSGLTIEPAALAYLLEMAGTNLAALGQELDKAIAGCGERTRILAADLEGILGRSREHSVFELTDALVKRRAASSLRLLNRLLDDGEEALRILAMIAWITRQLVVAHDLAASGKPRKEVLGALAGRWDQRGEVLDRARASDRRRLARALAGCADADLFVKRLSDTRKGADRLRPARGRLEALCRQICAA